MCDKKTEGIRKLWIREEIDRMIAVLMDREEREGFQTDLCQEIAKELEHLFLVRDIPLEELPDEPWV